MFTAFYSLALRPFAKEIKPEQMFASSSHQELLARLSYLKDHRGIGMVTGEPGSGKTSSLMFRGFFESFFVQGGLFPFVYRHR